MDTIQLARSRCEPAGLVSAMYMREGQEVACPDPAAGLYIRNRQGAAVRVTIPADHVAFQMGEAMQVSLVAYCLGGYSVQHCARSAWVACMSVSLNLNHAIKVRRAGGLASRLESAANAGALRWSAAGH